MLAGLALGVAIATKYQAGIVLVTLIAAAFASPVVHARVRNLALALGLLVAGFFAANPYALLDNQAFRDALEKQTETAGEDGGKLGLANTSGWRYYLQTFTWGFGWLPSLFALGGAVAPGGSRAPTGDPARARAAAAVPVPGRAGALLRALAAADLPDPVPARGLRGGRARRSPARAARARPRRAVGAAACAQGALVFSVHNDRVLAGADTRWEAREWMKANIPAGSNIVMEPIAPDQWAMDAGTAAVRRPKGGTGSATAEQVAHVALVLLQRPPSSAPAVPAP